jgi:hypothetical protein
VLPFAAGTPWVVCHHGPRSRIEAQHHRRGFGNELAVANSVDDALTGNHRRT